MREFRDALLEIGLSEGDNGMIGADGKLTGIKYAHVLNDFGRSIKASGSHHLADEQKIRVINMLKKEGFPVAKIKNPKLRVAFNVQ